MRILALDVATRMGVADGEPGGTPVLSMVKLGREFDDHADVFARAGRWLETRLCHQRPDLLVLETPLGKHDSRLLFGLRGVMLGIARGNDVKVIEVSPATWRTYFIGQGSAKMKGPTAKAHTVELCARLGWGFGLDHNAAEAAGMWLWACAQAAPRSVSRHEPLFLGGRS